MSDFISKWTLGYKEAGGNESGLLGWERKVTDARAQDGSIVEVSPMGVETVWCVNTGASALVPGTVVQLDASEELLYSVEAAIEGGIGYGIVDPFLSSNVAVGEKFSVIRQGVTLGRANGSLVKGQPVGIGPESELAGSGISFGRMLEAATANQLRRVYVDFKSAGNVSGVSRTLRVRATAAQVNAGLVLLPALPGMSYRLHDASLISIGGNASGATSVDILGVQSAASVKLMDARVAGLTQNTLLRAGTATNGLILAGGASFVANDVNTAISINHTGGDLATSTHIDVLLTYEIV